MENVDQTKRATRQPGDGQWRLLSNHGHVLLAVAIDPGIRVQDLARTVGITPRATLLILSDLDNAGYIHRQRVGRRTRYTVHRQRPFRHPAAAGHTIEELIAIFTDPRLSAPEPRPAEEQV